MNVWYVIIGLVVMIGIGFASTWRGMFREAQRRDFAVEYLQKFRQFALTSEDGFDGELYYWLTHRGPKIQDELGIFGVASYRPPAANYMFNNYQLIINILPEIRSGVVNSYQIASCEEALIRYIGWLDDRISGLVAQLCNPVTLFRNGFRWILSLPATILYWFGLIGESSLRSFSSSRAFTFVSGVLALFASITTILSYFMGPEELEKLIRGVLHNL